MNDETAADYLTHCLRQILQNHSARADYSAYGYDLYLPGVLRSYVGKIESLSHRDVQPRITELSPHFYAAAWELCRRGILRPGVRILDAQATSDGSAGNGYSLTPFGRTWITESDRDDYVPTEPGRFAIMLKPFASRYGSGFYERAQEAIRCYGAHAYLACCAMCGAAAESILLSVAIARKGEDEVYKAYATTTGRSRVENMVIGHATAQLQREFRGFTSLLKYWRDEAAHGKASGITDNEAYTSLGMLLRFALYVDQYWTELVGETT